MKMFYALLAAAALVMIVLPQPALALPHHCGGTVILGVGEKSCAVVSSTFLIGPASFVAGIGATPMFSGLMGYSLRVDVAPGISGYLFAQCHYLAGLMVPLSCTKARSDAICAVPLGVPCSVTFTLDVAVAYQSPIFLDTAIYSWAGCYDVTAADVETFNSSPMSPSPCPSPGYTLGIGDQIMTDVKVLPDVGIVQYNPIPIGP